MKNKIKGCMRFLKRLFKVFWLLCVVAWIIAGVIFVRFYKRPKDVQFLVPKLTEVLLPVESNIGIQTKSVYFETHFNINGFFTIKIQDLRITDKSTKKVIAVLPEVLLHYSLFKLITFDYRPDVLEITSAKTYFTKQENGKIAFKQVENESELVESSLSEAETDYNLASNNIDAIFKYLFKFKKVKLKKSSFIFYDLIDGKTLKIQDIDCILKRKGRFLHKLDLSGKMQLDQQTTFFKSHFVLNHRSKKLEYDLNLNQVSLSYFKSFFEPDFKGNLNFNGDISGYFDFSKGRDLNTSLKRIKFQFTQNGKGDLSIPAPVSQDISIENLNLHGESDTPLRKINLSASLTGDNVFIKGRSVIQLNKELSYQALDTLKVFLELETGNLPISLVQKRWPSSLLPDVYQWIDQNIKGGEIDKSSFKFSFQGSRLENLYGEIFTHGSTVQYFGKLPPLSSAKALVRIYPDRVDIKVNQGQVLGQTKLISGQVQFYDLDTNHEKFACRFSSQGPLTQALEIIDADPLNLVQMFDISALTLQGDTKATTEISFPLKRTLTPQEVKVSVKGTLDNASISAKASTYKLEKVYATLDITEKGLDIKGKGFIHTVPVSFNWKEDFNPQKISSVYKIALIPKAEEIEYFFPSVGPYIKGKSQIELFIQKDNKQGYLIDAKADLKDMEYFLFPINYRKKEGQASELSTRVIWKTDSKKATFEFLSDKELTLKGQGEITPTRKTFSLDEVISPENNFKGYYNVTKAENKIHLFGSKIDLSQLRSHSKDKKEKPEEIKPEIPNINQLPKDLDIQIEVDKITFVENKPLRSVKVNLKRLGYQWQTLNLFLEGKERFYTLLKNRKTLLGGTEDLGDILLRLGINERLLGGDLSITGFQEKDGVLKSKLKIKEISLKDSGFMTQALTILGIIDAFRGKELTFDEGEVPLKITPYNTFYIEDGYLVGKNLGITFSGRFTLNEIGFFGSVIPAYAINSLPGKIPVIGGLFRDSLKGGVFGVKYDIKGSLFSPAVEFHPLSSAAPGILGRIFK